MNNKKNAVYSFENGGHQITVLNDCHGKAKKVEISLSPSLSPETLQKLWAFKPYLGDKILQYDSLDRFRFLYYIEKHMLFVSIKKKMTLEAFTNYFFTKL